MLLHQLVKHPRCAPSRHNAVGIWVTYSSGDFCASITAATGIPKFDAGPQKSNYELYQQLVPTNLTVAHRVMNDRKLRQQPRMMVEV